MAENLNINSSNYKILLHACCGICSAYPISLLQDMGYVVYVYFYNPNIYPEQEYQNRLNAEKTLCEHFGCELIIGKYEPEVYYEYVKGLENEPEKGCRCDKCFELRLEKTAQLAKDLDIKTFTTSIVISPHKNYDKLTKIGKEIAQRYNLDYLAQNFRKQDGFLKTNKISNSLNLYRQNYCGCKFAKIK
jgi:hypothetical protein